ncbi:KAT8 regulatory NSL complex subunit 1-like protein [Pelodytes ibericus]
MTPALTETATQGPEVHFCPSLALMSLSADTNLCVDASKAVEQISLSKANGSTMVYTETEQCLQTDITNLKQVGTQSSAQYQTVFLLTSSAALNLQNKNSPAWKMEEWDTRRQRFHTKKDALPLFTGVSLQPERKVKRELFPGNMSQMLADVHKLWDTAVTKAEGMDGNHHQNCLKNGKERRLAFRNTNDCSSLKGFLNESKDASDKESEINSRLLHCLKQQQMLMNRAKRNQKHLQCLLANHAAEHCSQQIKCFVNQQMQNMQASSTSVRRNDGHIGNCTENRLKAIAHNDFRSRISHKASAGIKPLSGSAAGILRHIEQDLDSDATESSSDEDCVDKPRKTPRECNAEHNWNLIRASVGSRWVWLQAQISELEYKIQQLADVYSQIRTTKEKVMLDESSKGICKLESRLPDPGILLSPVGRLPRPPVRRNLSPAKDLEMSPSSPTLLLRNIEKQSARLTEMVTSLMVPVSISPTECEKPNGHKRMASEFPYRASRLKEEGSLPLNGFSEMHQTKRRKIRIKASSALRSNTSSSARTRPLRALHKRKLYRPSLHCSPAEQALLSPEPLYPCNESPHETNRSATRISCDTQKRFGLLSRNICDIDPYFHSVLSLACDIPLNLHFDALLKNSEIKGEAVASTFFTGEAERHALLVSSSWNNGRTSSCKPQERYKMRGRETRHMSENEADNISAMLDSLKNAVPVDDVPSSTQKSYVQRFLMRDSSSVLNSSRRRIRSENSYDIDNIVIPMSLVAPAKVEKLQYKEIITPRWKEVVLEPLEIDTEEELEDLSDEAFSCRHQKYELKEKARWSLWEQRKWPKRCRSSSSGFSVWAENMLPSFEDCSNSSALFPIPRETVSPDTEESVDEPFQNKVEQWERRIFPLSQAAALCLLDKVGTVPHQTPGGEVEQCCLPLEDVDQT